MWKAFGKNWFLFSLALCFLVGFSQASALQPILRQTGLRDGLVFLVMWAMGVSLPAGQIKRSITQPRPSMLAIGLNMIAVPLLCLPCVYLLPRDLFGGLFVTAIVPCTLASASVWTRKAGGDDSISMMTTVVTNLGCVLVVPLAIWLVLAKQVQVNPMDQVNKLTLLVAFPLILSQMMRLGGLARWADHNKGRIGVAGQFGILVMVFFGSIASGTMNGAASNQDQNGFSMIALMIFCAVSIHCVTLFLGISISRWLGMNSSRQIAIGLSGSQKTLMVGLQIAIDCGVSVIPMITYHLGQLLIDTIVADRWRRGSSKKAV
ncbi:bile acid:sodium symporter [Rhodopirellula sp.]|nr:bile acid:sodium symporter [Rhodopirellula sp.]MDB4678945.1 bile acid:sodium symporter [Rhodopirellula sp.]